MSGNSDPAKYEAWYHTPRGAWIAEREFTLMMRLLRPQPGASLLDIGCGTGYFSRRFAGAGLRVTGLDTDSAAVIYAHQQHDRIDYIQGMMQELPFDTAIFDYCAAVTSLCFVSKPENAIREMWRVCRRGVVLGLLNRHSLLYWQKKDRGGYRGARWDTPAEVDTWLRSLQPVPQVQFATAVYLPGGGMLARWLENAYSSSFLWGSFLAVYLEKS